MKNVKTIVFGVLLVVLGGALALKAFDIISFNIFSDGWWTFLFIVPAVIGLFTEKDKIGNLIVAVIFSLVFLSNRSFIDSALMWKLAIPAVIVAVGVGMIISSLTKKNRPETDEPIREGAVRESLAAFSGTDVSFDGEVFEGAKLTAVFGGIKCDLRGAVIEKDCEIRLTSVFGGIDILVPEGVNVKTNIMGLFGGSDNKIKKHTDGPTIYVNGECIFGGAEIK